MKLRNLSIEFSGALLCLVARLFMFLLIFNEQRVPKYFRFSSYLLRKPLLIRSIKFICNIDRDWMIYRKHPIRSLLTSMLRKANIRYPSDVYALSFVKYKKGSNYREFFKDKNVLLMYTTVLSVYKYAPNLESLLTQQYACVMCTLWSDNTCVFTRFYSVKNANMQLIWSSVGYKCLQPLYLDSEPISLCSYSLMLPT
jgi:hypothetical protein